MASRLSTHVDGDDVSSSAPAALGHQESYDGNSVLGQKNLLPAGRSALALPGLGYQRKRPGPAHIGFQFKRRIANTRRETGLIDPPQGVEVRRLKIADGRLHHSILDLDEHLTRTFVVSKLYGNSEKFQKSTMKTLLV